MKNCQMLTFGAHEEAVDAEAPVSLLGLTGLDVDQLLYRRQTRALRQSQQYSLQYLRTAYCSSVEICTQTQTLS